MDSLWVEHRHSATFSHATEKQKKKKNVKQYLTDLWWSAFDVIWSQRNPLKLIYTYHDHNISEIIWAPIFVCFVLAKFFVAVVVFFCGSYILIAYNQSPETMAKSKFQQLKNNQINSQFSIYKFQSAHSPTHHSKINYYHSVRNANWNFSVSYTVFASFSSNAKNICINIKAANFQIQNPHARSRAT